MRICDEGSSGTSENVNVSVSKGGKDCNVRELEVNGDGSGVTGGSSIPDKEGSSIGVVMDGCGTKTLGS